MDEYQKALIAFEKNRTDIDCQVELVIAAANCYYRGEIESNSFTKALAQVSIAVIAHG